MLPLEELPSEKIGKQIDFGDFVNEEKQKPHQEGDCPPTPIPRNGWTKSITNKIRQESNPETTRHQINR